MTAVVIAAQPNRGCIHVATDAAIYNRNDQCVVRFQSKVYPVPNWPGLVTATGNVGAASHFTWWLTERFQTWDALIEGVESALPDIAAKFTYGLGADIILAGVSERRGPEIYSFRTDDSLPLTATREEVEASDCYAEPLKLVRLPDVVMTPVPADMVIPAHYEGIEVDGDPDAVIWSLRKIIEMQRHTELPAGIGGIGGFATVATVSRDGITQRMMQRWPEDRLSTLLRPAPIDWKRWHRDNPKPGSEKRLRVV